MHLRLTGVPELLGASHSAYETAVESFQALVRVKMAPTRLKEYLGSLRQSPQGDADRRLGRVWFGAGADLKLRAFLTAEWRLTFGPNGRTPKACQEISRGQRPAATRSRKNFGHPGGGLERPFGALPRAPPGCVGLCDTQGSGGGTPG
jgi:hypothetical protein